MSAGERMRVSIGASTMPSDLPDYEKRLERLREGLGEDAFGHAWAEGEQLPLETLIEDAVAVEPADAPVRR